MVKSKADKQEKLNKDLRDAKLDDEELDPKEIDKGVAEESKEHPEFDKKIIKQLVMDHLKMDDDYYEKE